jgi:hypothetical protein
VQADESIGNEPSSLTSEEEGYASCMHGMMVCRSDQEMISLTDGSSDRSVSKKKKKEKEKRDTDLKRIN